MSNTKLSPLETKHLVSLGAGMLIPIPILGEAVLAYGLGPIIKETGVVGPDSTINYLTSIAVAGLTRIELYKSFYLPAMESISKLF